MTRILGIDPGLRTSGFALLDTDSKKLLVETNLVAGGAESTAKTLNYYLCHCPLCELPQAVSCEAFSFQGKPIRGGPKMHRLIEALMCAAERSGVLWYEPTTRQCKASIGLRGCVTKRQVVRMVETRFVGALEGYATKEKTHIADAVAAACYGWKRYERYELVRQKLMEVKWPHT